MDPVKQGDTPTLEWDLDPEPASDSTVKVIITEGPDITPIVARAGTLIGARVSITLTAQETDRAGQYVAEVEVTSGGVKRTYPHDGYDEVRIVADLG